MTGLEKQEKQQAAWHEAGHCLIADHYEMPNWMAYIVRTPDQRPDDKTWIGRTWPNRGVGEQLTAFQLAVFGWAGPIAEHPACTADFENWPEATLEDFDCYYDESEQSATDLENIHKHPQQTRVRKMALQIVIENRGRLRQMAEALERDGRIDGWKGAGLLTGPSPGQGLWLLQI